MQELYKDVHHYKDNDFESPKEHFKFVANIIENIINPQEGFSILDVGCAKGEFLYYLKKRFKDQDVFLTGVDFSQTLIDLAKKFKGLYGIELYQGLAESFNLERKFDVITATGLISCYDDYEILIDNLLRHLTENGMLIITNGFSTSEYDMIMRYRRYDNKENIMYGWNQHSIPGIKNYIEQKGKTLTPYKFELPFAMKPQEDTVRSWTIDTNEGQKFSNGLNLIWNIWSLVIK